jgi:Family of unknown function (DUF6533)
VGLVVGQIRVFCVFLKLIIPSRSTQILLYDHALTLDQEVEEIWKAKWTLPKIFFLVLRYMVPVLMIIETYRDYFNVSSRVS